MILEAKNIIHRYGDITALDDVSLKLNKGEILGLLGENGAGKSTLISVLCGLLKASSGQIFFNGKEINQNIKSFRRQVGLVPQEISLFDNLTVRDNLYFWASSYGICRGSAEKRIEDIAKELEFLSGLDKVVSTLSGGYQRRINIAASIIHQPDIVILDEPTVGVDVHARNIILSMIKSMSSNGTSIIYTSHYIDEIQRISDTVNIIKKGKIISEFTKKELVKLSEIYDKVVLKLSKIDDDIIHTISGVSTVKHITIDGDIITIAPFENFVINDILGLDISDYIVDIDVVKNTLEHKYIELTK